LDKFIVKSLNIGSAFLHEEEKDGEKFINNKNHEMIKIW
jgi:hypothetical protein